MSVPATAAIPMVRALFRAVRAPGGSGALYAKTYYPAVYAGSLQENNTGSLPAAVPARPYPLAILMPGINVAPDSYAWLASALAQAGFVAMLYGWIVEEAPGQVALSPGLDIGALAPDRYGSRPSATALSTLIDDLRAQNRTGPLAGLLDLDRILLGGHSAGGSVALLNARPDWFPGLRAVFAYGAHSKASTMLGYPPDTLLPLSDALPALILGGDADGVIAASAFRYGDEGTSTPDPVGPLRRTFAEARTSQRGDCYLAIVRGANHFSLCWPADRATGRPFLDAPTTRPDAEIRSDLATLVTTFARAHVANDAAARTQLTALLSDPARIAECATR